jgi:hypothetical protein
MCIVLPSSIYSLDEDPDSKPPCLIICRIYIRTLANGGWRRTWMCNAGQCGNIALFHMSTHSKRKAKWRGMMAPFHKGTLLVLFLYLYGYLWEPDPKLDNAHAWLHTPASFKRIVIPRIPAACPMDHGVGLYTSTFSLVPQFAYPTILHRCEAPIYHNIRSNEIQTYRNVFVLHWNPQTYIYHHIPSNETHTVTHIYLASRTWDCGGFAWSPTLTKE